MVLLAEVQDTSRGLLMGRGEDKYAMQLADASAAWIQWIERVEPEERAAVAELLAKYDTTTFEGMSVFLHEMIVQLFAGKVSPVVITAALPLLKELQTSLFMVHKFNNNQPEMMGVSLRQTTQELFAAVKPVNANYRITKKEDPLLIDAVEVPLIPETIDAGE